MPQNLNTPSLQHFIDSCNPAHFTFNMNSHIHYRCYQDFSDISLLCVGRSFSYYAVWNSHRRAVGPPQHDSGPCWLGGAACGRAEGSPPRTPPPATPSWSCPRGTRTRCAGCSKLESWWAPRPARSRSSCSGTASAPSASAAPPRPRAALGRAAG